MNPNEPFPRCPNCGIALAIPEEFRGRVIRCLECRVDFQSRKDGSVLRLNRLSYPPKILVPMVMLILLGAMGVFVNGYYAFSFRQSSEAIVAYTESTIAQMNAANFLNQTKDKNKNKDVAPARELPPEERRRQMLKYAEEHRDSLVQTMLIFASLSGFVLLGGISFAYGRWTWLAGLGCLAAIVNLNHGCCFPGAVAGLWGLMTILSDVGQRHFGLLKPLPEPSKTG